MQTNESKMIYRYFGKTGIQLSALGYGNWINSDFINQETEELTYQCVKACYDAGINYFDTAEGYGMGNSERCLGKALKKLKDIKRSDLIISTKLFMSGNGLNDRLLSRKHIIEGTEASLHRLELDYVDIIYANRPDPYTPIEEIVRAFNYLIDKKGKSFYWGTSFWNPQEIMEANEICEKLDMIKPIGDQCEYNLLKRENVEVNNLELYNKYGIGLASYSPLCGGLLSGKYIENLDQPNSRYSEKLSINFAKVILSNYQKMVHDLDSKIKKFTDLSKSIGYDPAPLAIAWCLANSDVSVVLIGASNIDQIKQNLKSIEIYKKWNLNVEKQINDIFLNEPIPMMDWKTFQPLQPRRLQSLHTLNPETKSQN